MKKDIQPPFVDCKVTCACGHTFMTKATVSELSTELCSKCHPFFTGEQVLIDTAGQVERFNKKMVAAQKMGKSKVSKKELKKEVEEQKEETNEELLEKLKKKSQKEAADKAAKKSKPKTK